MPNESTTLFLLNSLVIGGSEKKTVGIVNRLTAEGVSVHLGYLNPPETLLSDLDQRVPRVCLDRRGRLSWYSVQRLERYVRAHDIARIIAINLYPLLYASCLRLVMGAVAPAIVVTVNTTRFAGYKEKAQMTIYAPLLRRADRIVFGCSDQLHLWTTRYRLPGDRCAFVYNGVDSQYFSIAAMVASVVEHRAAFGFAPDEFVVGTVGQFRREKQQTDLIEAIRRLRAMGVRASGLIVGAGECEAALKQCARSVGMLDYIRFPGELGDVRPALAAMDAFALTSVAVETFSNAALEAMSMGRAVVLSDLGGAREMVWRGSTDTCIRQLTLTAWSEF